MKRRFSIAGLLIISAALLGGCVADKAIGASEGTDGFAVRVSSNPAAGGSFLMTPEAIWLQSCFSYASSPFVVAGEKTTCARVCTMGKKKSFLGSLFGVDDSAMTMSYIAPPGETPEQSATVINAAKGAMEALNHPAPKP